jgi:hypothetical protein
MKLKEEIRIGMVLGVMMTVVEGIVLGNSWDLK